MSSSPTRRSVIVGLFITAGLVILAAGILTIGDLRGTFAKQIPLEAVFPEVSGLQQGDNVWFSGLKVGTVSSLAFLDGAQVEVKMMVDEKATAYLRRDALAKLSSDGLIGRRIVVLYGGTPEAPLVQPNDRLEVGSSVSTEEVLATLQENNKNLLAITTDIKSISAGLVAGTGTLGKLFQDDSLYTSVQDTVATLDVAADNAARLTASLATFSSRLNQPGKLPHDLVNDETTYASLTATVADLRATGQRAAELVDGLATAAADPSTPVGTMLLDGEAGTDLKQTLAQLEKATVLLNEDLIAIRSNFLFRPYFRKQEREAAKAARQAK